ncbi:MAG: DNA primase [Chloroflexaceae bacterium]|nr:DNA primase [Chloroflexaceae bacterium]
MEIPRLHPETIEEVRDRVDIVEIISEQVVLKKRGKDYLGLCPFHTEKSPSFSVSPSKQLYYCFGCGAGGNAFKFLMETGQRSFSEVVLDLARRYQVPLKTLAPQQRQELQQQLTLREQLYEILAIANSFFQHALRQPLGEKALNYLKDKRLLREETIQQFGLGYAPAGWETLYRYLIEQKRYPLTLVEQGGLIRQRQSGSGYYDQFRDRLIIPIGDAQGRIIGFGSRSLAGEEPKYLNSPETELFDKSKTLFALNCARQSISRQDEALVVEGYFDAISLHEAGITNAVASLGTAFTQYQLRALLRYTESKRVIFNFDADRAGIQATQRAISEIEPLVYSGQVQLRILNLPGGKDADEFLKSSEASVEQYRQQLQAAPLWIDWQIEQFLKDRDLTQADQLQQVMQNLVNLLSKIEHPSTRDSYIARCAEWLSRDKSAYFKLNTQEFKLLSENLHAEIKKRRRASQKSQTPLPITVPSETSLLEEAEALLLRIYLHCPQFREQISAAFDEKDLLFSLSYHRFLWQQIVEIADETPDIGDRLLAQLQTRSLIYPDRMEKVTHLLQLTEKSAEDIFRAEIRIREAIASLERVTCEKYRRYCLQQWQSLDPNREEEQRQYYFQEFQRAQQRLKELEQQRLTPMV